MDAQDRVLLKLTTAKDGALMRPVLEQAGISAAVCATVPELIDEMAAGAAVLVLSEEALADAHFPRLQALLGRQEPWSDIPVLMLARTGANSVAIQRAMNELPNVTVIERPVRVASLVSSLRSAQRARRRQYELKRLVAGLQEADKRKNEFLATLAHELRNPLAPITHALELLRRRDAPEDEPTLAMIRRQVAHLVRLVDDLMEVSRITRGRVKLQADVIHVSLALNDALDVVRPLIARYRHRLIVHDVPDAAYVNGDQVRLAQVFANLLTNAAKYTPPGGTIEVATRITGPEVVVDISDNGAGIQPGMLEAVFEMFVQGESSARAGQGGLGIGLTLARALIELHRGRLQARSPGSMQGSTFTVVLPVADRPAPSEAPMLPSSVRLPDVRVLVTDDNRDAADSLGAVLEILGAEVAVAYGGEQALALATTQSFDAAIMDIGMAGMDGYAVARELRSRPATRSLPLIALTGWGGDQDRARIAAAGFDHHLLKPADTDHLVRVLDQALGRAAAPADGPARNPRTDR